METGEKQEKHKFRAILDSWKENLSPTEYELVRKGLFTGLPVLLVLLIAGWFFIENHEAFRTLTLSLAALIGLPLLVWRGVSLDRSSKAAEKQAENASKSHVADTYTKAIEQLGAVDSKGEPNLELRLGGLYALEKIAKANEDYHPQITEVLCAYVRMHCPREYEEHETDGSHIQEYDPRIGFDLIRIDIQACLTVIGKRKLAYDTTGHLNLERIAIDQASLYEADLSDAKINKSNLNGVNLVGANLIKADLSRSNLNGSNLSKANLSMADLTAVNLIGSTLIEANLSRTQLINANLSKAGLCKANLTKANLIQVDFLATDLSRADLREADLIYAKNLSCHQIESAEINQKTRLPDYIKVTWAEDGSYTCEMVEDSN
jgi:uncharacterized protein YjbI with pentapeptide repeats